MTKGWLIILMLCCVMLMGIPTDEIAVLKAAKKTDSTNEHSSSESSKPGSEVLPSISAIIRKKGSVGSPISATGQIGTDYVKKLEDNNKVQNQKPAHAFDKKTEEKRVNFYLMISQEKNYPIYKNNPYNVDAKSLKPSYYSLHLKSKIVYVSRTAKVNSKMWYRISYNGKLLGWINANGLSSFYKNLNVPVIRQLPQLPTGCEITAVTMMLQYAGAKVDKLQLTSEMPRTKTMDGNLGFIGSPYKVTGGWIYPPALMNLVKKYTGNSINMTGAFFTAIKKQINRNHPVVVWVAGVDGFVNHALTVTGYSQTRVYYNDPWTGEKSSMTISEMEEHRKADNYRAISY